jgi:pyruvate dehydrogenase E2 component (dihydrolipoamide acetyltransferase)
MAVAIIMPKFEMAQESGTIARWLKQVGDPVSKGEAVLEVETDKITMEVESPADGVLAQVLAEPGARVPIGQPVAYLTAAGEPGAALVPPSSAPQPPRADALAERTPKATPIAQKLAAEHRIDLSQVTGTGRDGQITRQDVEAFIARHKAHPQTDQERVAAVPAARRMANELGVDLNRVTGSGPGGRVQSSDVARAATAQHEAGIQRTVPLHAAPTMAETPEVKVQRGPAVRRTLPLSGMRRTIAQRMSQSMREAPQFNLSVDVDMSRALAVVEDWRAAQGEGQPKMTLTALLVKACAWALGRHPALNAGFEDEAIVEWGDINIGVAVAMDDGLIVPVIHHADQLGLLEIAARLNDVAARGREGRLSLADVQGGTFTLSNLGMFAVDRFTAIVNPPQAAILAIGRAVKRVVPGDDGQVRVAPMATLTVSADHRVVDGAQVGRFLSDLQRGLERPGLLL